LTFTNLPPDVWRPAVENHARRLPNKDSPRPERAPPKERWSSCDVDYRRRTACCNNNHADGEARQGHLPAGPLCVHAHRRLTGRSGRRTRWTG
jgi:hypothetical protein